MVENIPLLLYKLYEIYNIPLKMLLITDIICTFIQVVLYYKIKYNEHIHTSVLFNTIKFN